MGRARASVIRGPPSSLVFFKRDHFLEMVSHHENSFQYETTLFDNETSFT